MTNQPKNRIKSLSISAVKMYKAGIIFIITLFVLLIISEKIYHGDGIFVSISIGATYVLMGIFIYYPRLKEFISKIKEVSYDDKNLYVKNGNHEIIIPFYQIRNVELVSLDGLYKFQLFQEEQFGKEVICKPSLWYPLNYPKIDAELNRLKGLINKSYHEQKGIRTQ